MGKAKILISILNYNGSDDTIACIKSFYRYEDKSKYCLVIWDNASTIDQQTILIDGLKEEISDLLVCTDREYGKINIQNYSLVLVKSKENLGFARANNAVIRPYLKQFEFFVLLNNDTEFIDATTNHLITYLNFNEDVGIVSSAIYYYYNQNAIWNAGGKLGFGTRKYYTEKYVNEQLKLGVTEKQVGYITGCYFVTRRKIFEKYGLLTENFFFGEEDFEFCYRMKQHKEKLVVLFNEKIFHKVGASAFRDSDSKKRMRLAFVHHLNRMIDMKSFYPHAIWNLWRIISSMYIFIQMVGISKSLGEAGSHVKLLNYYAERKAGVEQEFYLSVRNGKLF